MTLDVLIVGPASRSTGGVAQYLHEQTDRLGDEIETRVHDIATPKGEGILWAAQSLMFSLICVVQFPRHEEPDVVHVHSSHGFSFFRESTFVLWAAYVWRRPVVMHIHGSSFDDFVEEASIPVALYQSLVFGATSRVIVLSPYWAEVLSQRTDREKLLAIPNAVNTSAYDPRYASEPPTITFISNHIERKGVVEFVEAIDRINEAGLTFTVSIAGSGPLDHYAERLAQSANNVTYYGYVSEERKRELLSESSIYALPTHGEGLPFAMLEGMAGGNAIISTTVGSIPEVIDEENGRLVEPQDVDDLTEAIAGLLAEPDLIESMGKRNRTAVENRYDWNIVIDDLNQLYRSLIEQTPSAEKRGRDPVVAGE